jgi:hypothetical protein
VRQFGNGHALPAAAGAVARLCHPANRGQDSILILDSWDWEEVELSETAAVAG